MRRKGLALVEKRRAEKERNAARLFLGQGPGKTLLFDELLASGRKEAHLPRDRLDGRDRPVFARETDIEHVISFRKLGVELVGQSPGRVGKNNLQVNSDRETVG